MTINPNTMRIKIIKFLEAVESVRHVGVVIDPHYELKMIRNAVK